MIGYDAAKKIKARKRHISFDLATRLNQGELTQGELTHAACPARWKARKPDLRVRVYRTL